MEGQTSLCLFFAYVIITTMNSAKRFWFLAEVVERAEVVKEGDLNPNRRLLTWVNTLLIHAQSLAEAYDKSIKIAKKRYPVRYKAVAGNTVQWIVLGLSSLKQIEEELKDGSEISWTDIGRISVKHSNSLVKNKQQLISG
jgi:hypothetical protein